MTPEEEAKEKRSRSDKVRRQAILADPEKAAVFKAQQSQSAKTRRQAILADPEKASILRAKERQATKDRYRATLAVPEKAAVFKAKSKQADKARHQAILADPEKTAIFKTKKCRRSKARRQAQRADPVTAAKLKAKDAAHNKATKETRNKAELADPAKATQRSVKGAASNKAWRHAQLSDPAKAADLKAKRVARYQARYADPELRAKDNARAKAQLLSNPVRVAKATARATIYMRERRKNDPAFYLVCRLRTRTWIALNSQRVQRHTSTTKAFGCTREALRAYVEAKFTPGMTWHNTGEWHIDHVRPLASFDLRDPEQFAIAAHYTNLQPLWAADNLRKGAKWTAPLPASAVA